MAPGRRWATVTTTKALALALGLAMATVTTILSVSSAFAENPPTVTAVLASSGPTTGGQRVTVEGTNLDGDSAVDFGDDHGQHGHDGDDDRTSWGCRDRGRRDRHDGQRYERHLAG